MFVQNKEIMLFPKRAASVIIVSYQGGDILRECIASIIHSKYVSEIILIDNCSSDGSLEAIKEFADDRLNVIRMSSNVGLCKARNLGASIAIGEYLAFVDQDTKVHRNWLEEPLHLLDNHPEIGAVQCMNLSRERPEMISHGGIGLDGLYWNQQPSSILEHVKSYRHVLYPIGAGFVIRRDAWDAVKGFDPDFFVGYDDVDLGIRMWLRGFEVVCASKAIVYHDQARGHLRSRKGISVTFAFFGIKNLLSMWTKNLSFRMIIKHVLPFCPAIPVMALIESRAWGIMAILSFLRDLPAVFKKRAEVQSSRRIPDQQIIRALQHIFPAQELAREVTAIIHFIGRSVKRSVI